MLTKVDTAILERDPQRLSTVPAEVEQGTWDRFDDGDLGLGSAILNDHRTVAPVSSRPVGAPARTG